MRTTRITTIGLFTLKDWCEVLSHIDPVAIEHLEKHRLIDVTDATVASEVRCSVCKECKWEALDYGRSGRSCKVVREVLHTDIEANSHHDVSGMSLHVLVDEASRNKHGFTTRDSATDQTGVYIDEMACEGVAFKFICEDCAGELGRSVKVQRIVAECGGE